MEDNFKKYLPVKNIKPINTPFNKLPAVGRTNAGRLISSRSGTRDKSNQSTNLSDDSWSAILQSSPPLKPKQCLLVFGNLFTQFEKKEITNFTDIYYSGKKSKKINGSTKLLLNNGYDDEEGDYIIPLHDHLNYRYEILKIIGTGTFGQVCKCLDHKTNENVAIKVIKNNETYTNQGLEEAEILKYITDHDTNNDCSLLHMSDQFIFRNHLCLVFELLGTNLFEYISNLDQKKMPISHVKLIAKQLLSALRFLSTHNLIHCDLKPENILFNNQANFTIKLIDLGSSCYVYKIPYTYIQSRYYRAPEVILGLDLTCAIDMWSLGCILFELCTGYPLFPGDNEHDQLLCIMEVFGIPEEPILKKSPKFSNFFNSQSYPILKANNEGIVHKPDSIKFSDLLKSTDPLFIDFLNKCFDYNHETRIKPEEALKHGWFSQETTSKVSAAPKPLKAVTEFPSTKDLNQLESSRKNSFRNVSKGPTTPAKIQSILKINTDLPKNGKHTPSSLTPSKKKS